MHHFLFFCQYTKPMSSKGEQLTDIVSLSPNNTLQSPADRAANYTYSVSDSRTFWSTIAKQNFFWKTEFSHENVLDFNFDTRKGEIFQKWFADGTTNVCYNCLDRHVEAGKGNKVAFYWEGNTADETRTLTYAKVLAEVRTLSSILRCEYGIQKGDIVTIYLPLIPFGPIAMLAVARIGAVCNVVFSGFSATALAKRMIDGRSGLIITADTVMRGEKVIRLKETVDAALAICERSGMQPKALVFERHGRDAPVVPGRDLWYADLAAKSYPSTSADIEWVASEHNLFVLYTSGSTGSPKGILHTTGGYMVYAGITCRIIFNIQPNDVYFCTADLGWITGHTYGVFGPMLNAATCVLFEGIPLYPTPSRWWEIVDRYSATVLYTAPTAIRALMKEGEKWLATTTRDSLRLLGSVGEPISAPAWQWYHDVVGRKRCEIVDTWWQTETGGILITPLAGCTAQAPGSVTLPFFGIEPAVLDGEGGPMEGECEGPLAIRGPWPGQARSILGDHQRYVDTYFRPYPGFYFSGDGCRRDSDGYYWITGRVDDVLNVSGHRIGAGEVENAINQTPGVMESAVISIPHAIKGEAIFAFVILKKGVATPPAAVGKDVVATVRQVIGPIATPEGVQISPELPKTRSGKIMRRILRKIAVGQASDLGDVTTLADPSIVDTLAALCEKNPVLARIE